MNELERVKFSGERDLLELENLSDLPNGSRCVMLHLLVSLVCREHTVPSQGRTSVD